MVLFKIFIYITHQHSALITIIFKLNQNFLKTFQYHNFSYKSIDYERLAKILQIHFGRN